MNLMSKQYGQSNEVIDEFYNEIKLKRIQNIEKRIRQKMILLNHLTILNHYNQQME